MLLANHGSVVCAGDLMRAVDLCEELEAAAELALDLHGRDARLLDPGTAW
ncbi:MAG TPA: class II aldolase/adducin family protein [Microbacterium sp.]|nr:class II aldolase/adducin family protein [Microbacterium sp.]